MFDKNQFDKEFNRMGKIFKFMFAFVITFMVIFFCLVIGGMIWAGTAIHKHGLKGAVSNVWNGTSTNTP